MKERPVPMLLMAIVLICMAGLLWACNHTENTGSVPAPSSAAQTSPDTPVVPAALPADTAKPAAAPAPVEKNPELPALLGMKFVRIPAGSFFMGSEKHGWDIKPVHKVTFRNPFEMLATEVTTRQFFEFVQETKYKTDAETWEGTLVCVNGNWTKSKDSNWRKPGFAQTDNHPVVCVSWNDADQFCKWLSDKTGQQFRLPTEAEWEYACRAGSSTEFFWGEQPDDQYFWYVKNTKESTAPAGLKKPNAWGLYDMLGNSWEWCADWHDQKYYLNSPEISPAGPSRGTTRSIRGGGWNVDPSYCHSAYRVGDDPEYSCSNLGFRIVRVLN